MERTRSQRVAVLRLASGVGRAIVGDEVAQRRAASSPTGSSSEALTYGVPAEPPHAFRRGARRVGRSRHPSGARRPAPAARSRALPDRRELAPGGGRDADRPRVGDRVAQRAADPPHRVGRELQPAPVIEALDGAHQTDRALLDEVFERHAAPAIRGPRARAPGRRLRTIISSLAAAMSPCSMRRARAGSRRRRSGRSRAHRRGRLRPPPQDRPGGRRARRRRRRRG